jgi:hypothetical protein
MRLAKLISNLLAIVFRELVGWAVPWGIQAQAGEDSVWIQLEMVRARLCEPRRLAD